MAQKGGRIPPDGRPPQAKGVGKNAKRHDLERPATPGLHGSDLQQGDVQAMEQGQRIAPRATQQPATPSPQQGGGGAAPRAMPQGVEIPDAIDFLADQQGTEFNPDPSPVRRIDNSKALTWMPVLRQLAQGPGSSGQLAAALIDQARQMAQGGAQPAFNVNLNAVDDGIEAMLGGE